MKKVYKDIVAWIYSMFLIIQLFSIFSDFIIQNGYGASALPFFNFWNALGTSIFENWLTFSILFIMIFVSGVLAVQFKSTTNNSKHFLNFVLLCINLFLCNRLYNSNIFKERLKFIGNHFWGVLGFMLIVAIVLLIGYALKKAKEASFYSSNIGNENNIKNTDDYRNNDQDELFMKRYPISYIWNNFKYYLSLKRKIKYQKKAEYHKIKANEKLESKIEYIKKKYNEKANSYNPNHNKDNKDFIVGVFVMLSVVLLNILIIIWFFNFKFSNVSELNETLSHIKDLFSGSIKVFNKMGNPILNWLSVFGNVFLLMIVIILINFFAYCTLRIIAYFILNTREDSLLIKRFSRQLKTFFFKILDSVVELLLFFPDFLGVTEEILFDIDVDKLVREKFEEFDNQSNDKKTDNDQSGKDNVPKKRN